MLEPRSPAVLARPGLLATDLGLVGIVVPIIVMMIALGFAMPTSTVLAMAPHPHSAGTAAALLGSFRVLGGAFTAPLVGAVAAPGVIPMATVMVAGTVAAVVVLFAVGRPWRLRRALDDEPCVSAAAS